MTCTKYEGIHVINRSCCLHTAACFNDPRYGLDLSLIL